VGEAPVAALLGEHSLKHSLRIPRLFFLLLVRSSPSSLADESWKTIFSWKTTMSSEPMLFGNTSSSNWNIPLSKMSRVETDSSTSMCHSKSVEHSVMDTRDGFSPSPELGEFEPGAPGSMQMAFRLENESLGDSINWRLEMAGMELEYMTCSSSEDTCASESGLDVSESLGGSLIGKTAHEPGRGSLHGPRWGPGGGAHLCNRLVFDFGHEDGKIMRMDINYIIKIIFYDAV